MQSNWCRPVHRVPSSARGEIRTLTERELLRGLSPRGTVTTGAAQACGVPFCMRLQGSEQPFVTASAAQYEPVAGSSRLFRLYAAERG